jgi:hypothetical protein
VAAGSPSDVAQTLVAIYRILLAAAERARAEARGERR